MSSQMSVHLTLTCCEQSALSLLLFSSPLVLKLQHLFMREVDVIRVYFLQQRLFRVGNVRGKRGRSFVTLSLGVGDPDVGPLVSRYWPMNVEHVEPMVDTIDLDK